MKKICSTLLFTAIVSFTLFAQPCGTNGPSVCTPMGGPAGGGFDAPDSVRCAERNVAYDFNVQFTMFTNFNFQGQHVIDSMEFVNISNLPCGICWAVNKESKRYVANEDGCIRFSGTTNDAAGQYKLGLDLRAWIDGIATAIPVSAFLADQSGIRLFLRVKENGAAACASVDTSAGANNLTATTGCSTGINTTTLAVSSVKIFPNPFNSAAVLSFTADRAQTYTMRIADVAGRVIEVKTLDVKVGANQFDLNRNTLSKGMYFLTLSDGTGNITKSFTITD